MTVEVSESEIIEEKIGYMRSERVTRILYRECKAEFLKLQKAAVTDMDLRGSQVDDGTENSRIS